MLQHHCVIKLIPLQIWGFQKVISTADFIVKITFPAHSSSGCAIISQLAACERVCTQRSVKGKWLQFPVPACRDEISCVCVCVASSRVWPGLSPDVSLSLAWRSIDLYGNTACSHSRSDTLSLSLISAQLWDACCVLSFDCASVCVCVCKRERWSETYSMLQKVWVCDWHVRSSEVWMCVHAVYRLNVSEVQYKRVNSHLSLYDQFSSC